MQLLIYGYVVATDLRALPMAVLDQSGSAESRRLEDRFVASGYFTLQEHIGSLREAERYLNSGRAMLVLVIPARVPTARKMLPAVAAPRGRRHQRGSGGDGCLADGNAVNPHMPAVGRAGHPGSSK